MAEKSNANASNGVRGEGSNQEPKGAARIAAKQNINGGLTTAQRKVLTEWEDKHRNYKTERVVAIDENGKVTAQSKKGTRNRTALPWSGKQNEVITHNHPITGDELGAGVSFSGADISAAISRNAKEIRVVANGYTYSLRRPKGGWGDINAKSAEVQWNNTYSRKSMEAHRNYFKGSPIQKDTQLKRFYTVATHQITKEMAKQYGWEYTRKRTK